jgi:glycosyltransferase involved in cell wall biosynthesis
MMHDSSKHIVITVNSLRQGGIEKSCLDLAKSLERQGYNVSLVLFNNIIQLDTSNFRNLHFINSESIKKIEEYLLQLHQINPVSCFIHTRYSVRTKFLNNTYYIIHNVLSERISKANSFTKFKKVARLKSQLNNQKIICVSKAVLNDLTVNIKVIPRSTNILPNIYSPNEFQLLSSIENKFQLPEKYIASIASFNKIKRHDVLLSAFSLIKSEHKLLLVGDGNQRDHIEKLILRYKLKDKVILVGWQKNPYPFIKHASAIIISSDSESLSSVVIESLMLKTPVISTACLGPKEILGEYFSNYIVNIGDSEGLALKIDAALESYPPILPVHYEKYSADYVLGKYQKLIEEHN